MIEINLLPDELRKKETVKLNLPEIPILKILPIVVAAFFALLLIFVLIAGLQQLQYTAVRAQIADLTTKHGEMIKQKSDTAQMGKKLTQLESMADRRFYWWQLLNALTDSTTKGVWLRSLSLTEMMVQPPPQPKTSSGKPAKTEKATKEWFLKLDGSTIAKGQETAYVGRFIKELKDNRVLAGLFENIELSDMNQRTVRDYDVYDFILLCKFKKGQMGKS